MINRQRHQTIFALPMWAIYLAVAIILAIGVLAFACLYSAGGAELLVTPS